MKSNFGTNINYSLFGESHGSAIGITITGLPANFTIDLNEINELLEQRQGKAVFNTPRQEKTNYNIVSGYFNNKTTGTPLCVLFPNENTQSKDYSHLVKQPRPGHADQVAQVKYQGAQDYRGGGHFSGRITTPIVFAGALIKQIVKKTHPELEIISHISNFQDLEDYNYYYIREKIIKQIFDKLSLSSYEASSLLTLSQEHQIKIANSITTTIHNFLTNTKLDNAFPVYNTSIKQQMLDKALALKANNDSAGGSIETVIINPPLGVGEPFFNSYESVLAQLLYSIPSVQGTTFGYDNFQNTQGSNVKDEIISIINDHLYTLYNYNGGLNGGITNGEDIVYTTNIKPISSLAQQQYTYSHELKQIAPLDINGRHDSTIINRVIPVINAMSYIALYELILEANKNG